MTVFSLKPARTSLTTAAFVSGASACCALVCKAALQHMNETMTTRTRILFIDIQLALCSTLTGSQPSSDDGRLVLRGGRRFCPTIAIIDSLHVGSRFPVGRHSATKLHHRA